MKSFVWFVVGVIAAAIGALALARTPQGKAVLAELDDSAGTFFEAMATEYQKRRSDGRN